MKPDFLQKMVYERIDFMTDEDCARIEHASRKAYECLNGLSHLDAVHALMVARQMVNESVARTKVTEGTTDG